MTMLNEFTELRDGCLVSPKRQFIFRCTNTSGHTTVVSGVGRLVLYDTDGYLRIDVETTDYTVNHSKGHH